MGLKRHPRHPFLRSKPELCYRPVCPSCLKVLLRIIVLQGVEMPKRWLCDLLPGNHASAGKLARQTGDCRDACDGPSFTTASDQHYWRQLREHEVQWRDRQPTRVLGSTGSSDATFYNFAKSGVRRADECQQRVAAQVAGDLEDEFTVLDALKKLAERNRCWIVSALQSAICWEKTDPESHAGRYAAVAEADGSITSFIRDRRFLPRLIGVNRVAAMAI